MPEAKIIDSSGVKNPYAYLHLSLDFIKSYIHEIINFLDKAVIFFTSEATAVKNYFLSLDRFCYKSLN